MLRTKKPKKPKESGQALVEFALALLVFIPILFVVIDFGWISFQRVSFEYGYMHSSWAITAADVGNSETLDANPTNVDYSGSVVSGPLETELMNSTTGIIKDNLKFVSANAHLRDIEESYKVASIIDGVAGDATSRTRYMDLKAVIRYTIRPLTPIGSLVLTPGGGGEITIEKDLVRTKIVGTQQRSE